MSGNHTKYNVKKVTETEGKKHFEPVATALIYEGNKAGIIKSEAWGDLKLFLKDKPGASGSEVYTVKKGKPGKEEGKTILNEVGTFIVRPGGETGVLFIHLLEDSFAVFRRDSEKEATNTSTSESAEVAA